MSLLAENNYLYYNRCLFTAFQKQAIAHVKVCLLDLAGAQSAQGPKLGFFVAF